MFLTQLLRVMRVITFLIFVFCMHVSAKTVSQNISFTGRNVTLKQVFAAIELQTDLGIVYNTSWLKDTRRINIQAASISLAQFLDIVFQSQPLEYAIDGKAIIVRKRPVTKPSVTNLIDTTPPISGIIRGADNKPVAGANIIIKGSKKGTISGFDGSFLIDAQPGEVLIISNIGYLDKKITIESQTSIGNIQLQLSESKLDDVQIIAYGQTSKRLNTGNVVTVKSEEIEKQPVNNPLYALQGRVPGLQITPTTGLAGGAVNLQIRGKNTLNVFRNSEPLIVVDGLPVINNVPGLGHEGFMNASGNQLSALNFLNPNDISSIEVLKDADATSIYGSRGANGVVLVTTKKGKAGKTSVDVNFRSGAGSVPEKLSVLNTQQYLAMRREAIANNDIDLDAVALRLRYTDVKMWDQNKYTDWQEQLIGGRAKYHDAQAAVSGGNSLIQYLISGNYHKETTVFPGNNNDQKAGVHLSLNGTSQNEKFKTAIKASYLTDHNTLPPIDFTATALRMAPNAPGVYKDDGTLNWELMPSGFKSWDNPYYNLNSYDAKVTNLVAGADLSYRLLPSLTLKAQLGYNKLNGNAFKTLNPFKDRSADALLDPGAVVLNTNGVENLSVEPQINYTASVGRGNLSVLVGGSFQQSVKESSNMLAYGFTSDALVHNLGAATDITTSNTSAEYKYTAVFGRISYNWENKYIINLNGRRDGSSRFGPGNQFGNFGSIGAAWLFSNENFIKDKFRFLSSGKLRFSYGTTGNDGIGDYGYLERYQPITGVAPYQGAVGFRTMGLYNNYYAWETVRKMEIGLEAGLLKDRIFFSFSAFSNRSDNQLIGFSYPSMAGPGSPLFNRDALIQNSGIELLLTSDNIKTNKFSWSTSFNITRNRNKLIDYPGLAISPDYRDFEIGAPYAGVARAYDYAAVDPQTGQYVFIASDGKKVPVPEDVNRLDNGRYLRIMTDPKFYGGISNSFSFKNFSLDFLVQFTKQTGISYLIDYLNLAGVYNVNVPSEFLNRWKQPGDVSDVQKIFSDYFAAPFEYVNAADYARASSRVYTDASFIRLKNLSLSYNISASQLEQLRLQQIRVFLQAQNLLTITNYKGLDPETQSLTALPPLRVITAGFQITF